MTTHTPPKGSGRGFRRAGMLIDRQIRSAGESRGFAVTRLLTHWPEAVGPELARIARPVKIGYGRAGIGATLTVLTKGASAPLVEARKEELRARVNACYGYNAISRVRITQTAGQGFADDSAAFAPAPPKTPSAQARAEAETLTQTIDDPELRAALTELGSRILDRPSH